ncbi:MAG: SpaA isopeptide-forming pilin-related protein, partial [Nocardioidaceae bacterium]
TNAGTTLTLTSFDDARVLSDLIVKKVAVGSGEVLAGAKFQLWLDDGDGILERGTDTPLGKPHTTDANGLATWANLTIGDYIVEEVAAPPGYLLPVPHPYVAATITARTSGDPIRITFEDSAAATTPRYSTKISDRSLSAGDKVFDRVTVFGLQAGHPLRTRWTLYGPFQRRASINCGPGHAYATGGITVTKNGTVRTPRVTVKQPGFYTYVESSRATRWYLPRTTKCGLAAETTLVKGDPSVRTVATRQQIQTGAAVRDTVVLSGLPTNEAIRVTGFVYGPAARPRHVSCGPAATPIRRVSFIAHGDGRYTSPAVTLRQPGWYTWVQHVAGTSLSSSTAAGCGDPRETLLVFRPAVPVVPTIDTGVDGYTAERLSLVGALRGAIDELVALSASGDEDPLPLLSAAEADAVLTAAAKAGSTPLTEPNVAIAPHGPTELRSNNQALVGKTTPMTLSLPRVGIRAGVAAVGVDGSGLAVPSNVDRVGWFDRSARFDDLIGSTVIAGHVSDGHDNPGAFWELRRVHVGDTMVITRHANVRHYQVTGIRTYTRSKPLPASLFSTVGRHAVRLVSCTNKVVYPDGSFHYRDNLVVTAAPMR